MKDIDRDAMEAARASVQRTINWLKEERERLEAWMRPEREALKQREQEVQEINDKLRKLEAFVHATSDPPRSCETCKKRSHCSTPASDRTQTGCGFWSAREEESRDEQSV